MKHNTLLRIGGVPEHFNLPVLMAIENGAFEKAGIKAVWQDFPGGTGAMTAALRNNEIDMCILLTEGIIKDILKGNPSKLLSIFVNTPICWGVHTGYENPLKDYKNIWNRKFAISRFGSGSHLMPLVDANSKGEHIREDQFKVINNLESALESLVRNETDVFYWEKFMTKPYVEKGQLRRLGEFYSPWPCFVIAGTLNAIERMPQAIRNALRIIHTQNTAFMNREDAVERIAQNYNLDPADAKRWFHSTEWAEHGWISNKMIKGILYMLELANIISSDVEAETLIWQQ